MKPVRGEQTNQACNDFTTAAPGRDAEEEGGRKARCKGRKYVEKEGIAGRRETGGTLPISHNGIRDFKKRRSWQERGGTSSRGAPWKDKGNVKGSSLGVG